MSYTALLAAVAAGEDSTKILTLAQQLLSQSALSASARANVYFLAGHAAGSLHNYELAISYGAQAIEHVTRGDAANATPDFQRQTALFYYLSVSHYKLYVIKGASSRDLAAKYLEEALKSLHHLQATEGTQAGADIASALTTLSALIEGAPRELSDELYDELVAICQKSQAAVHKIEDPWQALITALEPHSSMWKAYHDLAPGQVTLRNANFAGLLFDRAELKSHFFLRCNLNETRWIFGNIEDCDFSDSQFVGVSWVCTNISHTKFTNCNFAKASFKPTSFTGCSFVGADFTDAMFRLRATAIIDVARGLTLDFADAVMQRCKIVIFELRCPAGHKTRREVEVALGRLWSAGQLAVMTIEYEDENEVADAAASRSDCFIATAVCGEEAQEVTVLRRFRDDVLLGWCIGRQITRLYYRCSPRLAAWLNRTARGRRWVRQLFISPVAAVLDRLLSHHTSRGTAPKKSKASTMPARIASVRSVGMAMRKGQFENDQTATKTETCLRPSGKST